MSWPFFLSEVSAHVLLGSPKAKEEAVEQLRNYIALSMIAGAGAPEGAKPDMEYARGLLSVLKGFEAYLEPEIERKTRLKVALKAFAKAAGFFSSSPYTEEEFNLCAGLMNWMECEMEERLDLFTQESIENAYKDIGTFYRRAKSLKKKRLLWGIEIKALGLALELIEEHFEEHVHENVN